MRSLPSAAPAANNKAPHRGFPLAEFRICWWVSDWSVARTELKTQVFARQSDAKRFTKTLRRTYGTRLAWLRCEMRTGVVTPWSTISEAEGGAA